MKIGVTLRNMGPQSDRDTLRQGAKTAEALGFESVWVTDHLAIPPDDAEGSGGRYLDTLTTLAWLGGITERIGLGSGVLNLPYRAILPVAKQLATIAELTGGRLIAGFGVGWMQAEFNALGVPRRNRGQLTDDYLEFLNEAFENDVLESNGQQFLFKPRPAKPEMLIGGAAPHAVDRAIRHRIGWLPMAKSPDAIRADVERLKAQRPGAAVSVMTGLNADPGAAEEAVAQWRELGVDRLIVGQRYDDLAGCLDSLNHTARSTDRL